MKIDLALVCDYALIDQYGKLSVMGIFEHIWVQQFPVVHPRLHLVMRLKGRRTEIGEHPVSIRLLDEDEKEIISGNGTVTFAEPPAGVVDIEAGSVLVFDVPLEKPGRYRFEITVDESITANVPLTVGTAPEEKRKQES
ncbi:MAG: hypothetical protein OEZ54_05860 [Gemmatimonadota bacterium]|nr:hypothetical protein [Gemmatimonadota bacterium]